MDCLLFTDPTRAGLPVSLSAHFCLLYTFYLTIPSSYFLLARIYWLSGRLASETGLPIYNSLPPSLRFSLLKWGLKEKEPCFELGEYFLGFVKISYLKINVIDDFEDDFLYGKCKPVHKPRG